MWRNLGTIGSSMGISIGIHGKTKQATKIWVGALRSLRPLNGETYDYLINQRMEWGTPVDEAM